MQCSRLLSVSVKDDDDSDTDSEPESDPIPERASLNTMSSGRDI